MKARIHYRYDYRHKRKPIRIEAEVYSDHDTYVMDVHGRFATQREASLVGRDIGARYDEFTEHFGRIEVSDNPPQIVTID